MTTPGKERGPNGDAMEPIKFAEANSILDPSTGNEKSVLPLPVYRGYGQTISCWELNDLDVENIVKTRKIWLHVWSTAHPPVLLNSEYPFKRT